eukprot:1295048-Amphidinium_carterae.1
MASNPTPSSELLESTLQEGCFASCDEITTLTMMLLAAAHGALGKREKMRELYKKVFAKCTWETLSMSIDEASTARARDIFTTRRCVDAEDIGQAILWQDEELVVAGLCLRGHSLSPARAIGKRCDVCNLGCPRTAWSWECRCCDVDVCPACMAAFGLVVLEVPRQECGSTQVQLEPSTGLPDQPTEVEQPAPASTAYTPIFMGLRMLASTCTCCIRQ